LMVLVGAATAQEYTWRTMHLWLSRGLSREALIGAKFLAILIPLVLFVLTPLIVGGGVTAIFTLQIDKSLPLGQIDFWHLVMSVVRTTYTLLPYAALTFMLAIVFRSTAAAIGISLAYTLLIEGVAATVFTLLGGIWRDIVVYLPGSLASVLMKLNSSGVMVGVSTSVSSSEDTVNVTKSLAPIPSAIGIALWSLAFLGLALLAFRRQDLSE
jgi:ABC-2 type transport system permease protein